MFDSLCEEFGMSTNTSFNILDYITCYSYICIDMTTAGNGVHLKDNTE